MRKTNEITDRLTREVMRWLKNLPRECICKAAEDAGENTYDNGWGWHPVTADELIELRDHDHTDIIAIQTVASDDLYAQDNVDTLIGMDDDTNWRVKGWSFYDLVHSLLDLDYVND